MTATETPLFHTPLHALHLELGARMVPFAGYAMPVQYPAGLMAEHRQCREAAALFDVSHMGQLRLVGENAAAALETLVPVDIIDLPAGKQRYALFTNDAGGLQDDLMVTRPQPADRAGFGDLFVVVNAGCKDADTAHLQTRLNAGVGELTFMTGGRFELAGADCFVTRSGYTGEDGFEISVHQDQAVALARALLAQPEVQPAGLGARDTLRLEAGLCLYGHDIDTATTPVEAALTWAIQKVRRAGGARAGGYPGAAVIDAQLAAGAARKRVGLIGKERAPVREGAPLVAADGTPLGTVTSGTLGPTVNTPIAMAYLPLSHSAVGTEVFAEVRGKRLPMTVAAMPFTPNRYHRG